MERAGKASRPPTGDDAVHEQEKPRGSGAIQHKRVRIPWPEDRDFRILAINGGGIRRILPATLLSEMGRAPLVGQNARGYFDLIAGAATGVIIDRGGGAYCRQTTYIYVEGGGESFPRSRISRLKKFTHMIECFIIKNGNCTVRSGAFVVNIKKVYDET